MNKIIKISVCILVLVSVNTSNVNVGVFKNSVTNEIDIVIAKDRYIPVQSMPNKLSSHNVSMINLKEPSQLKDYYSVANVMEACTKGFYFEFPNKKMVFHNIAERAEYKQGSAFVPVDADTYMESFAKQELNNQVIAFTNIERAVFIPEDEEQFCRFIIGNDNFVFQRILRFMQKTKEKLENSVRAVNGNDAFESIAIKSITEVGSQVTGLNNGLDEPKINRLTNQAEMSKNYTFVLVLSSYILDMLGRLQEGIADTDMTKAKNYATYTLQVINTMLPGSNERLLI